MYILYTYIANIQLIPSITQPRHDRFHCWWRSYVPFLFPYTYLNQMFRYFIRFLHFRSCVIKIIKIPQFKRGVAFLFTYTEPFTYRVPVPDLKQSIMKHLYLCPRQSLVHGRQQRLLEVRHGFHTLARWKRTKVFQDLQHLVVGGFVLKQNKKNISDKTVRP